jgi:serine phosphatase RsbU (regulator of sigma subunit)/pSer/pThr/pTyr-binding forkhead associated (FHA) protein
VDTPEFAQTQALSMEFVDGPSRRTVVVDCFPFVIGRSSECNLALPQSYVSRSHAMITRDGGQFALEDTKSRHGTFVNGEQVSRRTLRPGDIIQFGSREGPQLRFAADNKQKTTELNILTQLHGISAQHSDLEKLRWFLEAARDLNSAGQVDLVLASLLETTLALAKVERGYVFLMGAHGTLELALGRDAKGDVLTDASSVSRTVMRKAISGTDQFIVTDNLSAQGEIPESIVAHSIRTIICIPLRRTRKARDGESPTYADGRQVFGALYLESHFQPGGLSEVDHELMRTIAREAAALVDNAQLAVIEDQARKQEEELQIAAGIQRGLMAVQIPAFPFAGVQAHSIPCSAVGGDFFDVISGEDALNVALVDVSGKGISAAILASTLQGMLHVQLEAGQPLDAIAAATNRYLCQKAVGKYATMVLLRLYQDGTLEYVNCGHVYPRICSDAGVSRLEDTNVPVGLFYGAEYTVGIATLQPGSGVILVSDGVTEAEDAKGDFFGEDRLDSASLCAGLQSILERMAGFCAGHPANDDCTIVQVVFTGHTAGEFR